MSLQRLVVMSSRAAVPRPSRSCRCSHTFATAKCRFTVAGAIRSTVAVSATESPPKKRSSMMRAFCGSTAASASSAVVELHEIEIVAIRHLERRVERHPLRVAAALLRARLAGLIDEEMPDDPRRHREEVGAAGPVAVAVGDQAQIRLVDERGRLQERAGRFAAHVVRGQAAQLVVDDREELVPRALVPRAPAPQEHGHVAGGRVCHGLNGPS